MTLNAMPDRHLDAVLGRRILACLAVSVVLLARPEFTTGQPLSFEDVSVQAGVAASGKARAAAVHDFDGDGWEDIFVSIFGGSPVLYRNNGDGTFTDVADAAGLAAYAGHTVALWGDVDNDGLTDLFVGRTLAGQNRLYLNGGDGTFVDVSATSGISATANVATAAFGDYDGDGWIDLFLAVDREADILYRNTAGQGEAVFEDVSQQAGIAGPIYSVPMQATWSDYDRDGDLDLFCVHDSRTPSRLYRNSGYLPLSDVSTSAHFDTYPTETVCCNMGTAWGDFDGDGWLDAYVTRIGHGGLYRNNGDGTFEDVAQSVGVDRNGMSWGVVFSDFDNDSDQDLFIVSTSGYDGTPTLLYRNDGQVFEEMGVSAGVSFLMEAQGLATGDFNNDGLVDIFIPSQDGKNRLLQNTAESTGHWLGVHLEGRIANTSAIGTRVEAVANGRTLVRVVSGGDSFGSQSSSRLHFGLGSANRIDTLRIRWSGSEVEELTNIEIDRSYSLTEGVATGIDPEAPAPHQMAELTWYPNPSSGSTTIRYSVPQEGHVRIEVFDILGRRVAVPVDGFHPAGSFSVGWSGDGMPAGTYVSRLTVAAGTTMRTMLLQK